MPLNRIAGFHLDRPHEAGFSANAKRRAGEEFGHFTAGKKSFAYTLNKSRIIIVDIRFAGDGGTGMVKPIEVANLKGLRDMFFFQANDREYLVIGYFNGMIKLIHVTGLNQSASCDEVNINTSMFMLRDAKVGMISLTKTGQDAFTDNLCVLYEDDVIACVPFFQLLESTSWKLIADIKFWQLQEQQSVSSFQAVYLSCRYHSRESMFAEYAGKSEGNLAFVVFGTNPTWALYTTSFPGQSKNGSKLKLEPVRSFAAAAATAVASTLGQSALSFAKRFASLKDEQGNALSTAVDGLISGARKGFSGRKQPLKLSSSIYDDLGRKLLTRSDACDPYNRYYVTADTLGRVVLVDLASFRIIKIWKGYRNAKIGWMTSPEQWRNQWTTNESDDCMCNFKNNRQSVREASVNNSILQWGLYLVIFAPFRQILQIWRVPECILVSTIRVDPSSYSDIDIASYADQDTSILDCFLFSHKCIDETDCKTSDCVIYRVEIELNSLESLLESFYVKAGPPASFVIYKFCKAIELGDFLVAMRYASMASTIESLWSLFFAFDSFLIRNRDTKQSIEFHKELIVLGVDMLQRFEKALKRVDYSITTTTLESNNGRSRALLKLHHFSSLLESRRRLLKAYQALRLPLNSFDSLVREFEGFEISGIVDKPKNWIDPLKLRKYLQTVKMGSCVSDSDLLSLYSFLGAFKLVVATKYIHDHDFSVISAENGPVGKKELLESVSQNLGALVFSPLVTDPFLFPAIDTVINLLHISFAEQLDLFIDWFFVLDVRILLIVISKPNNGLLRFLGRLLMTSINENAGVLFVSRIVSKCQKSSELIHAMALAKLGAKSIDICISRNQSKRENGSFLHEASSTFCELLKQLQKLLFIVCVFVKKPDGLSIESMSDSQELQYANILAVFKSEGASESQVEEVSVKFGDQHTQGLPSYTLACHSALEYSRRSMFLEAIKEATAVLIPKARVGLYLRIWSDFAFPKVCQYCLLNSSVDGLDGYQELSDLCSNTLPILQALVTSVEDLKENDEQIGHADIEQILGDFEARSLTQMIWPPVSVEIIRLLISLCLAYTLETKAIREAIAAIFALKTFAKMRYVARQSDEISGKDILDALFVDGMEVLNLSKSMQCTFADSDSATKDYQEIFDERMIFARRVMSCGPDFLKDGVELAKVLQVSVEQLYEEKVLLLYRWEMDAEGEAAIELCKGLDKLGNKLTEIAIFRFAVFLKKLKRNPKYRHMLACISADTYKWINLSSEKYRKEEDFHCNTLSNKSANSPSSSPAFDSLSKTLVLLQRIDEMVSSKNRLKRRVEQLIAAASALLRQSRVEEIE